MTNGEAICVAIGMALSSAAGGYVWDKVSADTYRQEGRVGALLDQSIDGNMVYLMCLAEPPHCEKQKAISDFMSADADRKLRKMGVKTAI